MQLNELNKIIFDLLQYRRSSPIETKQFKISSHNKDLCPKIQEKIESIINSFEKYRKIVYDIQGVRDKGTDIILKESSDDECRFICFQIKSNSDLKEKEYLKILKSQWFDTESFYKNILNYYILLCADTSIDETLKVSKERGKTRTAKLKKRLTVKEKIRNISAEFTNHPLIYIIEPEYVLSFLKFNNIQIDSFIKSKFGSEDIVYKNALNLVSLLTPSESALLYFIMYNTIFNNQRLISLNDFLESHIIKIIYDVIPDIDRNYFFNQKDEELEDDIKLLNRDFITRIADDIQSLTDVNIYMDENERYFLNQKELQPLFIYMMDAYERYGYMDSELIFYLLELFNNFSSYQIKFNSLLSEK